MNEHQKFVLKCHIKDLQSQIENLRHELNSGDSRLHSYYFGKLEAIEDNYNVLRNLFGEDLK